MSAGLDDSRARVAASWPARLSNQLPWRKVSAWGGVVVALRSGVLRIPSGVSSDSSRGSRELRSVRTNRERAGESQGTDGSPRDR